MKTVVIGKAPFDFLPRRGVFPLEFSGEPGVGPARECIGLIERHVYGRKVGVQWHRAAKRKFFPPAVLPAPVERMAAFVGLYPIPSFDEPYAWFVVSACLHELEIFAVRNEARCQLIGLQVLLMPWRFIIVAEPLPLVTDFHEASFERAPFERRGSSMVHLWRLRRVVTRIQRALREQVLDVGKNEFLML